MRSLGVCFVDLTGYTRLTEERGDRFAADVAAQLASLVRSIRRDSRRSTRRRMLAIDFIVPT